MSDTHALHPERMLAMVEAMGAMPARLELVGSEPARVLTDNGELTMGLSAAVAAAVNPAVDLMLEVVAAFREDAVGA